MLFASQGIMLVNENDTKDKTQFNQLQLRSPLIVPWLFHYAHWSVTEM